MDLVTAKVIDEICDRFELDWMEQNEARIEQYLDGVDEQCRTNVLRALLLLDLELRGWNGDYRLYSEYLMRFPNDVVILSEAFAESRESLEHPNPVRSSRRELKTGSRDAGSSLRVRCPHCNEPVLVEGSTSFADIACPGCGSTFNLLGDETQAWNPDDKRLSHFKLVKQLGQGAFGSVWQAHDQELDRRVAIKIPRNESLSPEETEQFLREARAAAQLSHPNIVSVYEVGRDGDTAYIACEFVEGLTLADWLTGQRLTPQEAASLSLRIAKALHHAHESGVIHRDLKPSNIMIDLNHEPHIMDFGIARREAGEITVTVDGKIMGTPAYMSPEQARGEGHQADCRSDVYSIGVILFELVTGERPFRGKTRMLLHQLLHQDPPSPRQLDSRVPRDLETICLKCLEKEPNARYQTAADLADDINCFMENRPIRARRITRLERMGRWIHRNPSVAGLTAHTI